MHFFGGGGGVGILRRDYNISSAPGGTSQCNCELPGMLLLCQ